MSKIILISLYFLFGCVEKNESRNKQNTKYKGLVGVYIGESLTYPSVVTLNSDHSFSFYEFSKSYWLDIYGKWSIKNNELCLIIEQAPNELKIDESCMPYEVLNGNLITYGTVDGSGDVFKKIY